ncbi:hypothetical protein [uncultured Roseobacter sp.]|uniref:hypothetical protein n=1 Tax=uncultured Roseobacter sp. TaxID=114847 RepID=UPI002636B3D8|nr:hypothetical protein [uncultured Roseobacter sp.]
MYLKVLTVLTILALPGGAIAQMANNGGTTAPANTNAFGQSEPFKNVTTVFDGITFNLTRLIADPTSDSMYRIVGTLQNSGNSEIEVLFFIPVPTLVDELGNILDASAISGIDACRTSAGRWEDSINECGRVRNAQKASRLAANVPVTFSVGFSPSETKYSAELAKLSNTVTARIHFIYTLDEFKSMQIAEVVIPGIPLPQ